MPRPVEVFVFRQATREALQAAVHTLRDELATTEGGDLAELAAASFRQDRGGARQGMACRLGVVAGSLADLRDKLDRALTLLAGRTTLSDPTGIYYSEEAPADPASVCFLYPGQGAQHVVFVEQLPVRR